MRTVKFKNVLEAIARKSGVDPDNWSADNRANAVEFINSWVIKGWEWEFWPELTPLEQRAYRDAYDPAKAYPAPTATVPQEVWFPAAQRYYQALQSTTAHDPATLVNGQWIANAPYWADSVMGYSYGVPFGEVVPAPYYGSDWQPNTAYTAGPNEVHRNPGDDRFYQCILSHTSGATFDQTKWGILTVFERYVALDQTGQTPIGEVRGVSRNNPRTSPRFPGVLTFVIDDRGILPAPTAGAQVWVEFRLRPSQFTDDAYDAGTEYGKGDLVYQEETTGECYQSLIDDNTGNTPESNPTEWKKVDFPEILQEYAKFGAFSDYLRADGQDKKADRAAATADEKLTQASDVALASQAQYDRATAQV